MTPQHSRRRPKEQSAALPLGRKAFPQGRREAGQRQRSRPTRGAPRPSARCIFISPHPRDECNAAISAAAAKGKRVSLGI